MDFFSPTKSPITAGGGTSGDISTGLKEIGGISSPVSIGGFKSGAMNIPPWVYLAAAGVVLFLVFKK